MVLENVIVEQPDRKRRHDNRVQHERSKSTSTSLAGRSLVIVTDISLASGWDATAIDGGISTCMRTATTLLCPSLTTPSCSTVVECQAAGGLVANIVAAPSRSTAQTAPLALAPRPRFKACMATSPSLHNERASRVPTHIVLLSEPNSHARALRLGGALCQTSCLVCARDRCRAALCHFREPFVASVL
jgi:hypothetical protein